MSNSASDAAIAALHAHIANNDDPRISEALRQAGAGARALLDTPLERSGNTALAHAIRQHVGPATFQLLLKGGAGLEAKGEDGEAPLYVAAFNRESELVRILLGAGANPNVVNGADKETALHCAARFGFVSIAELLIKGGADTSLDNCRSESPMFIAAKANRFDMVYFLLSHDVPSHTPDRDGHSALYIASERGHKHVVALLRADKKALREVKAREEAAMKSAPKALPTNEELSVRIAERREEERLEAEMLKEMEAKKAPPPARTASPKRSTAAAAAATPPIEYEGERKVRTHDPITGKALGPCRTLEEVGYSRPAELPPGVTMPYQDPLPKSGGTRMHIGTGTGMKFRQPPDIHAGELEGDGIESTFGILQPVVF